MSKYAPHRQTSQPRANSSTVCQKCLKTGHSFTNAKSPSVLAKLKAAGKPSVEVPEEFKKKDGTANRILEEKAKEREKGKEKGKERESKKARRCVQALCVCLSNNRRAAHLPRTRTRTRTPIPLVLALGRAQILARGRIPQGGQENATANGASQPKRTAVAVDEGVRSCRISRIVSVRDSSSVRGGLIVYIVKHIVPVLANVERSGFCVHD
ncbi:hypothetical protein K438DRAFT_295899 [Mycena galopus ATCC 62051]|nr:hypothetical protein K438DRAFT_295899 [Mycena galopus ATCC 62051]